jgi:hypothetical protein
MTTEKLVNEVLFGKTELASQKIDLAINDDVKKFYNDAIAARKKSLDVYNNAKAAVKNAVDELKSLKTINENSLPVFAKFEALIKELGIPMPAEISAQKQNIQDGLKGTFALYIKNLESAKL